MKEWIELGLLVAGISQLLLCLGSVAIPGALAWREKLAVLPPLMRQLWWTYAAYVLASHLYFALLSLVATQWLMGGGLAAVLMSGFILLWWGTRLVLQLAGFDFGEVEPTLFNRCAKGILTLLFVALVFVYGVTFLWNLGFLRTGGGL